MIEVLYTTTLLTVSQLRICGSWDSSTRRENNNFEFFGNWSAKYNENLLMHLSTTPKNAWYLSPQIQNEMLDHISNSIPSALISKLNKSKFVSIIAYKSSDISMTEQMAVCLLKRSAANEIAAHELSLDFVDLPATASATITESLLENLSQWGIHLD